MSSEFTPQNDLEKLLVRAASEPSARPEFLRLLLESNVLIVPVGEPPTIVDGRTTEGAELRLACIEHEDRQYTPFFTSEARLEEGTQYLLLKARDLFELTAGSYLVMNPGGGYGKEFFPEEVEALLDGTYFEPGESRTVEEATQILIGQPAERPDDLLSELAKLYARHPGVRRAFMCLYHDPSRDEDPGLLILLDVASDDAMKGASQDTGVVLKSVSSGFPHVDLIRYDEEGIGGYFVENKIPPFYEKASLH